MTRFTRRRFLTVSAAAFTTTGALAEPVSAQWQGTALGARAQLQIEGMTTAQAQPVFAAVQAELRRQERIFSLYRADSALVELNRTGRLDAPPPELLTALSLCDHLNDVTSGAFDPTVQPMFQVHAAAAAKGRPPDRGAVEHARALTGWDHVRYDTQTVSLMRQGMALTLNGMAQGFVTDQIHQLLACQGLTNILVDVGEIIASGRNALGVPWNVGVVMPDGALVSRVTLEDRALATSSPGGTVLDPDAGVGHIFAPHTGDPANLERLVSVSAPSAALADGLSTAICLMSPERAERALSACPGARLETFI